MLPRDELTHSDSHLEKILEHVADRVKGGSGPGILFVRRRAEARAASRRLTVLLGHYIPAVTGELSPESREQIAEQLRAGRRLMAVATAVWSRGIDIPGLRWIGLCEGRAPIGVVQAAGRAARRTEDKETFEVWNFNGKGSEDRAGRLREEGLHLGYSEQQSPPSGLPPTRTDTREVTREEIDLPILQVWQKAILILLFIISMIGGYVDAFSK